MENQVFHIAVCDDVRVDREEIAEMAEEICKEEQICPEISYFENAETLLDDIEKGCRYVRSFRTSSMESMLSPKRLII